MRLSKLTVATAPCTARYSFHIRWYGYSIAVDEAREPVKLPVQAFDQMLGLARASQVVIFAREHHDLGGGAETLQRAEPLLALFDRHAEIVVGMQNQRRRFDVLRILQGRAI